MFFRDTLIDGQSNGTIITVNQITSNAEKRSANYHYPVPAATTLKQQQISPSDISSFRPPLYSSFFQNQMLSNKLLVSCSQFPLYFCRHITTSTFPPIHNTPSVPLKVKPHNFPFHSTSSGSTLQLSS